MKIQDKMGITIGVGDIIAYATRFQESIVQKVGKVLHVNPKGNLYVIALAEKDRPHLPWRLNDRPASLTCAEKALVISSMYLPLEVQNLFFNASPLDYPYLGKRDAKERA